MSDFKVEKGIPLPTKRMAYPFNQMEVGDSFAVSRGLEATLRSAASCYGIRNGKVFKVKRTSPTGLRCWRVE